MSRKSDWNLSKGSKAFSSFAIASGVAFLVPTHFSPDSETLAQVGELRLILYSLGFGLSFLAFGEMFGLSERRIIRFSVQTISFLYASVRTVPSVWFGSVGRAVGCTARPQ